VRAVSDETGVPLATVARALKAAGPPSDTSSPTSRVPKPAPTDYEKASGKLYDARPAMMRLPVDERHRLLAEFTDSLFE
jgi:hypothetical protein